MRLIILFHSNRLNFGKIRTEKRTLYGVLLLMMWQSSWRLAGDYPSQHNVREENSCPRGVADVTLSSLRFSNTSESSYF